MRKGFNRALCASTALASGLLLAGSAFAQSTATQVQELVVTGSRAAPSVAGAITQVQEAKDESIVTHELFERQTPGQNFGQLINFLPGVNYTSEDAYGNLSGDLRIHGFDASHLSATIDGSPVNDTGNYALYPGEYILPELTDRITVNMGATSVDSPTASAVGGTVDIITKLPSTERQLIVQPTWGSYNFQRYFVEADSGSLNSSGTRLYVAGNYDDYDKWVGKGDEMREGLDGRIYQPLKNGDFLSLAGSYVVEHDYFYASSSAAQFAAVGKDTLDYNNGWARPTATPGVADTLPMGTGPLPNKGSLPDFAQGNDPFGGGLEGNFWGLHPNPVIFGQIRGSSLFHINDKLSFTFDPSFFYTLANGGGAYATSESDPRLKGANTAAPGMDLNADGDTKDTVLLYGPSNTNTRRYLILASLLYDLDDNNHFALSYTMDYGRHRQTGELTYIDPASGNPASVFGGKDGWGSTKVATADGSFLRNRDRYSIAKLNQLAANYLGKFFDDRLHVNIGLRAPFFERDLNQYCYTYNGTSAYCDTVSPAAVQAAYDAGVAAKNTTALSTLLFGRTGAISFNTQTGAPNFRMPFSQSFKYKKVLPNVGATWRLTDNQLIYATYSQGFSAPKTDNLYTSSPQLVRPETSNSYAAGWRYQSHFLTTSFSLWDVDYKNRIVSSYDPLDPGAPTIDRNIGEVQLYGLDLEAGIRPTDKLSIYGSAEFMKSDVKSDEQVLAVSGVIYALPTHGKELVLTPDQTFSARAQYDVTEDVTVGVQAKYSSKRYVSDMNDASLPSYTTVDLDARWNVSLWGQKDTYLQVNVYNLFDTSYPVRTTSITNAQNVTLAPGVTAFGKTYYYYYNQPRTFSVTIHKTF
jgi:iron complex outermembrane receptor protein